MIINTFINLVGPHYMVAYVNPPRLLRTDPKLTTDINNWCIESKKRFQQFVDPGDSFIWVIKYFAVKHINLFLKNPRLRVSTSPGMSWGDAVYVSPLQFAYSSAMFGRAGVVGYIRSVNRIFDAGDTLGIDLYHKWILSQRSLFIDATTKVYSNLANRYLRNLFRWEFGIDLVMFHPDEFNTSYVNELKDYWFALSDWGARRNLLPDQLPLPKAAFSNRVEGCRWVVRVEEEFEKNESQSAYSHLIGTNTKDSTPHVDKRADLYAYLKSKHAKQSRLKRGQLPNLKDVYRLGLK